MKIAITLMAMIAAGNMFARTLDSYSPALFWWWNSKLDVQQLCAQLDDFYDHGARTLCIHPFPKGFRPGRFPCDMEPEYLSDGFLDVYAKVTDYAAAKGMTCWLYDEGGWPSGGACGQVLARDPERFAQRYMTLDKAGNVKLQKMHYRPEIESPYPSIIEQGVTETFIALTHERYKKVVGKHFGKAIPWLFTDEPSARGILGWCSDFAEQFQRRKGYDIMPYVPALVKSVRKGPIPEDIKRVRIDYYDTMSQLQLERFVRPCRDWCRANGLLFGGHFDGDDNPLCNLTHGHFNLLRALRNMDLPGVDCIWRQLHPDSAYSPLPRYASSAAHQIGAKRVLSETFAIYGETMTPAIMKRTVDFELVRGINQFVFAFACQSTKRNFMSIGDPHFGKMDPKWAFIRPFMDYVRDTSARLAAGVNPVKVGVYYDVKSIWAGGLDPKEESAAAVAAQLAVAQALDARQVDFDFADDDILEAGCLPYAALVLPTSKWLSDKAKQQLAAFRERGGLVLSADEIDKVPRTCRASGCGAECLRVTKRILTDGAIDYFLVNDSAQTIAPDIAFDEGVCVTRTLDPYASEFIRIHPDGRVDAPEKRPEIGSPRTLRDGWTVQKVWRTLPGKEDFEYGDVKASAQACALGDWRAVFGTNFSGRAVYRCAFVAVEGKYELDLGKVGVCASARLNGHELAPRFAPPFRWCVDLHDGTNMLDVTVGNTLANALIPELDRIGRDFPPKSTYAPRENAFYAKDDLSSGLMGPVTIAPCMRADDDITVSSPKGRIVFSRKDGSIKGVYAGTSERPIWRGGPCGLWRAKFKWGKDLDANEAAKLPGAKVSISSTDDGGFLGVWEGPEISVRVTAKPFARGVEFRSDVTVHGTRTVRGPFEVPAQLRFATDSVQSFTVASCRGEGPGITFNRGFFEKAKVPHDPNGKYYNGRRFYNGRDYFQYETVYPSAFSDFMYHRTPQNDAVAIYGVQARPPHEPWKCPQMFLPTRFACGGDAAGGFLTHAFVLWNYTGETYHSPAVRIAFGGSLFDALDHYAQENDLMKPLAAKMDAQKLETFKRGLFIRFRGPTAVRSRELLPLMPKPFTLHTTNYLRRPQDEAPPDWFPVSEKYGGDAGLKGLIADLHARGDLFCPYTNPTFWSDMPPRGPYFSSVGEAPLARFENGKPRPEGYSDGNSRSYGWTACQWHEAVRTINRRNRDRFVTDYPADLLFQDQCGSRGWVEDFNARAPSRMAHTEGNISLVEEDARVLPLCTEDGWDRIANEETALCGINGKMMMLDPEDRGERIIPALKATLPPDLWRWEAVAARLMHEKCIFLFHDLGPHVTNPRHLAWALGCGFGLSAYVYDHFDGKKPEHARGRAWLKWLDVLQQNVARRYAGAKVVAFHHDRSQLLTLGGDMTRREDDGVIVAQYGDMHVAVNLGDVPRRVRGEMLAPYGFSIRAPSLRAAALDGEEPYVEADGKRITRADCGFAKTGEPNLAALKCPAILIGDANTAYRDPAVYEKDGMFYLFYTLVKIEKDGGIYSYTAQSESRNLAEWTKPRILTPRNQALNYSSPGNVVKDGDEYVLCLQTYPRPGNTVSNMPMYANGDARLYTMRSKDLRTWSAPQLLRVKGDDVPVEKMGRMIDPYLLRDRDDPAKWWCFFKQNGASRSHSRDLKTWTYDGRVPAGENACVMIKDGEYILFHSPANGIAVKRSRDLVHWTDDPQVLTFGQKGWNWAKGRLTAGTVIDARHVKGVGKYLMFYHGSGPKKETEGDFDRNASIGIAWSDDLVHWQWPH